MGTWGAGAFDNDDALDYVADQMDELYKKIEAFFAQDEANIIEEGEGQIIPRIKLMTMFARLGREAGDPIIRCAPPEAETIEQWKTSYLAGFDEQIDDYDPDEEYKDLRREKLESVFDELLEEGNLLEEMMEEAQKLQEEEEEQFLVAAALIDDDPEVLLRCAEIHINRQNWQEAADAYEKALELGIEEDTLPFAYNNIAWSYAQLEEYEKALDYANKAIEFGSQMPHFYGTVGYIHFATDKLEEALEQYDKALEFHDQSSADSSGEAVYDPSLAETHYWRAKVHERLGNDDAYEKDMKMIKILGCKPPEEG